METARVSQFEHENQFIITTDNSIIFQSYESLIAIIDHHDNITLGRDWDYSKTTRRHLYDFLNEYAPYSITARMENAKGNVRKAIQQMIDTGVIAFDKNIA